jgi:hypothetical protein
MTFEELLETRAIARVSVDPREIADLLELARRDIDAARALTPGNLDWAFTIAYNARLQASVAFMNARGVRRLASGREPAPPLRSSLFRTGTRSGIATGPGRLG